MCVDIRITRYTSPSISLFLHSRACVYTLAFLETVHGQWPIWPALLDFQMPKLFSSSLRAKRSRGHDECFAFIRKD